MNIAGIEEICHGEPYGAQVDSPRILLSHTEQFTRQRSAIVQGMALALVTEVFAPLLTVCKV